MKSQDIFKVGKHDIAYVSEDFKKDFHGMEFEEDKTPIYSRKLGKFMMSEEILKEIKPTEVSLGQLYHALKSGGLDKDVFGYLAYVKNKKGVPRLVYVGWDVWLDKRGWVWFSYSVDSPYGWYDVRRVFSGNPLAPETSDTLPCPYCGKEIKTTKP